MVNYHSSNKILWHSFIGFIFNGTINYMFYKANSHNKKLFKIMLNSIQRGKTC